MKNKIILITILCIATLNIASAKKSINVFSGKIKGLSFSEGSHVIIKTYGYNQLREDKTN